MLTSDGAISSEVVLPEVLLQREFMRDVMSLGLLVGSLREIDFRDSHVSFSSYFLHTSINRKP